MGEGHERGIETVRSIGDPQSVRPQNTSFESLGLINHGLLQHFAFLINLGNPFIVDNHCPNRPQSGFSNNPGVTSPSFTNP